MFLLERNMIINFCVGDTLEMKKIHPCGGKFFSVLFAGSDVKIRCNNCGREMILPRVKIEKSIKSIKRVIPGDNND
mgnify:CR=1 FL=1